MKEDLTIRRYKPSDSDRVWTIHESALRTSPLEFIEDAPADRDITEISEQYIDANGEFIVGLVNDEIVAIGGFQPKGDESVEIRRMRVDPNHQRRGYGERILVALEDRAREREFERIFLDTNEHLTAARKLYEKHGYEESHRETRPATGVEFIYCRKDL